MYTVGIIETSKDNILINEFINVLQENNVDYILEDQEKIKANNKLIKIIKIRPINKYLERYKNEYFDYVIFNGVSEKEKKNTNLLALKSIFSRLSKESVAVINIDKFNLPQVLESTVMNVITYGLNSKATVTTSSIDEVEYGNSSFIFCSQRNIIQKNDKVLPPMEFPIKTNSCNTEKMYRILSSIIVLILAGIDIKNVQEKVY